MINRNDPCWCGSGKKWKHCHFPKKNPALSKRSELRSVYLRKHDIHIKDEEQIKGIRRACELTSRILDKTCAMVKEGITTEELNEYAHELHLEAGATPAPLHYGKPPYPKSICTSINEVICHGIPDQTKLKKGDIVNIDLSCFFKGYYGDCSRMVMIGEVSEEKKRVVDVSYECLMLSIEALKPDMPISIVGDIIEEHATKRGCSVVNQFVGHGIGLEFHEGPQIPHHRNKSDILFLPGMTFTIEPMINAGVREAVIDPIDKWTARTRDGKPSAQWEHTLLITDSGHEILTRWLR